MKWRRMQTGSIQCLIMNFDCGHSKGNHRARYKDYVWEGGREKKRNGKKKDGLLFSWSRGMITCIQANQTRENDTDGRTGLLDGDGRARVEPVTRSSKVTDVTPNRSCS